MQTKKIFENLLLYHVTKATVEPLERHVEDGDDEEQGNGSHEHAACTTYTQGDVTVGTHAMRKDKGQHTKDHGERGHEDGAQTHTGSRHSSHGDAHALAMTLRSILGKQDGCLGQETDEPDKTRLHIDIVLQAPHPREQEATQQAKGHAQDNSQGDEEALVEGT